MASIIDLVDEKSLRKLATPAHFRLGKEIAETSGVELVEFSPLKVLARVQPHGGQKRTVELTATNEGLKCRCA